MMRTGFYLSTNRDRLICHVSGEEWKVVRPCITSIMLARLDLEPNRDTDGVTCLADEIFQLDDDERILVDMFHILN